QELLSHFVSGCLVEPVEEPSAGGGLSESAVDLEAHPREELLHLRDRLQTVPLPPAEADRTGPFTRPVGHPLPRRGGGGGAPAGGGAGVVVGEAFSEGQTPVEPQQGGYPSPPHFPPAFHGGPAPECPVPFVNRLK